MQRVVDPIGHTQDAPAGGIRRDPLLLATLIWTGVALVYVTLIPVGNDVLLYPLLLSFAVIAAINIVRHRIRPDRALLIPAALWLAFLALGIATALARDAGSWPRTLVFFLIWPAVYSIVVAGFDRRVVRVVFAVGAWISVVIGALLVLQALTKAGRLPFDRLPDWVAGPLRMAGSTSEGGVSLTATIMPPLLWWGGIWIASLFAASDDRYLPPVWLRTLAGSLIVVGAVASWRRAIIVVLVATPVLALVALVALTVRNSRWAEGPRITWMRLLRLAIVVVVAIVVAAICQPRFLPMFTQVVASSSSVVHASPPKKSGDATPLTTEVLKDPGSLTVEESDSLSDQIRQNESRTLLSPHSTADLLVGRGFGAAIDRAGIERDAEPWKTELQYHALFYWTGVLGMLLMLAVAVTALLAVRKAYRVDPSLRGALLASTVGALCVLMANASNPYLQAPGHMWPLFFPLMIAAAALRRTDASTRDAGLLRRAPRAR